MEEYFRLTLSRLFNVGDAATAGGEALLQERYRALQRQIPLLLIIVLANMLGLHLATAAQVDPASQPR
jgi:predicted signal transduction protein with EAL and GGDEF domain